MAIIMRACNLWAYHRKQGNVHVRVAGSRGLEDSAPGHLPGGYVMQESIFKRELEVLKHLISVDRMFLQTYLREIKSLTSLEDLLAYLAHLVETHGEKYALERARMAKISTQVKQDIDTMSSIAFEQASMESMQNETLPRHVPNDEEDVTAIIGLRTMFERKKS
jgi:hypothetical protein